MNRSNDIALEFEEDDGLCMTTVIRLQINLS